MFEVAVEERFTVGDVWSYVRENVAEAVFPFPALSWAAAACTLTSTAPSVVGIMSAV